MNVQSCPLVVWWEFKKPDVIVYIVDRCVFCASPVFHRAVVLPLETMLFSEFDRDCSFTTGSVKRRIMNLQTALLCRRSCVYVYFICIYRSRDAP